jgi:hypothetical protein
MDLEKEFKLPAMTETKLYAKLKPWYKAYGVPIRLETATNMSVPDMLYVTHGRIILIEHKIIRGHKVKFRPGQLALFSEIAAETPDLWIAAWDERIEALRIARFSEFKLFGENISAGSLTFPLTAPTKYGSEDRVLKSKEELGAWVTAQKF